MLLAQADACARECNASAKPVLTIGPEDMSFVYKEILGLKQLVSKSQAIIEWIEKEIETKTKHFHLLIENHA
jgi:hypothetical protein